MNTGGELMTKKNKKLLHSEIVNFDKFALRYHHLVELKSHSQLFLSHSKILGETVIFGGFPLTALK